MKGGNFQELPRLFLVHIRKVYTLKQSTLSLLHKNSSILSTLESDFDLTVNWGLLTLPVFFFLLINGIELKETVRQYYLACHWLGENLQITLINVFFNIIPVVTKIWELPLQTHGCFID